MDTDNKHVAAGCREKRRMKHIMALPVSSALGVLVAISFSTSSISALAADAIDSEIPANPEQTKWVDMLANELDDWVVEGKKHGAHIQPSGVWSLDRGVLHCDGRGFGFLRYKRQVSDFVFAGEYKLARDSNSGIGLRTVPYVSTLATRPSHASYEIQLLDRPGEISIKGNMSVYGHFAPKSNPQEPHGQWNTFEITCRGPRLNIKLNGVTIHDFDQSEHETTKDMPLKGFVSVQNHHSVVEFRRLRLRELTK